MQKEVKFVKVRVCVGWCLTLVVEANYTCSRSCWWLFSVVGCYMQLLNQHQQPRCPPNPQPLPCRLKLPPPTYYYVYLCMHTQVCIEELKKLSREEGVKALPYAQVYKPGQGRLVGLDIPPSKVRVCVLAMGVCMMCVCAVHAVHSAC